MSNGFYAHTPSKHDPNTNPNLWHELKEHLNDVADRAEGFARKIGAERIAYYVGLWHDLGKYNPEFQAFLQQCDRAEKAGQKKPTTKVPHAIYGAILAKELLNHDYLSFMIAGHHTGLADRVELKSKLNDPNLQQVYSTVIQLAELEIPDLKKIPKLNAPLKAVIKDKVALGLFLRLVFSCLIDADRLDTEKFDNLDQYQQREIRANAVTLEQLWQTFQKKQLEFVKSPSPAAAEVNLVRTEVYENCLTAAEKPPGVFRLCVPTGGGKTRSGLAFALKHANFHNQDRVMFDRVIFAVPYTSIIDQTVQVYRDEIFKELGAEALLEHHSSIEPERKPNKDKDRRDQQDEQLENDEIFNRERTQAKLATQNWDAKLIVTTTVQLFDSLFSHKTGKCRKLHNIVNSVIVLDEVQTLPIELLSPIVAILKELVDRYNVTIVLCTATQPALALDTPYFQNAFKPEEVRDIIPPELAIEHFKKLRRVDYQIPQAGEIWTWQQLVDDLPPQSSALVVLNTRRDALAVMDALDLKKDDSPDSIAFGVSGSIEQRVAVSVVQSKTLHLSTLLCGKHRQVVLAEVKRRLKAKEFCRLISTQVVEAGVDLDFPWVYRALGPLDRIVQAAGRCNRSGQLRNELGEPINGRVVIFDPAEGSKPPAGEYTRALNKTRSLLQAVDFNPEKLHTPDIFQDYFQDLYMKLNLDKKGIIKLHDDCNYRTIGEEFKLIDDYTMPVVIEYDDHVAKRLRELAYRNICAEDRAFLQPYMVNIPKRLFEKSDSCREVKAGMDLWRWIGLYDSIRGIPLGLDSSIDPGFLIW
jgi:CRISPR-associated endonuclease/helicase Cas3